MVFLQSIIPLVGRFILLFHAFQQTIFSKINLKILMRLRVQVLTKSTQEYF
jgi:hypothetical protein